MNGVAGPPPPPPLPLVLSVGVTGHRSDAIPPEALPELESRLRWVLNSLKESARQIWESESAFFSADAPRFLLVSSLADGADQVAAEVGLTLDFGLQAILPFERNLYRNELGSDVSRTRFDALFERAGCILQLPGELSRSSVAYQMAGRATVAHCDLLVAVWDGLPPRGRGGTGEIVELALARGTPVVHVPVDPAQPVQLRWNAFDPAAISRPTDLTAVRPFEAEQVALLLNALLAPPPDPDERRYAAEFREERWRRYRSRIEYPLLLFIAGISSLGKNDWRNDECSEQNRLEWLNYRDAQTRCDGVRAPLDALARWYGWSDWLAGHFGQLYRSGHVFNFGLGAVAVLLALAALVFPPEAKKYLVAAEFIVILAILINTRLGNRQNWHRRWLDYRQLAERLRPMRSLKLLGLAAPDYSGPATRPAQRWFDWYSARAWRAIGAPAGVMHPEIAKELGRTVIQYEIAPQIAYHRSSAKQVELLDHRLEKGSSFLFAATLLGCAVLLVSVLIDPAWVTRNIGWFTLITAGLPAVGTAFVGIRLHSDLGARAARSESTAKMLETISKEIDRGGNDLMRLADLAEQAGRTMLRDLDEWRLINEQHDLELA